MTTSWKLGMVGAALALSACSSSRTVQVPPRVDLTELGTIGMVGFWSPQTNPELSRQANLQFLTEIQSAQPGVPILELGEEAQGLGGASASALEPAAVRAIGEKHGVDALLFGVLEAKPVKPKVSVGGGLESLSARAEIEGTLTAKMYDTKTGATLWTRIVADKRTVGALSVSSGGLSGGGTADMDAARSELFEALVVEATEDFRPGWARVEEE
jgi:hypothetical protein